MRIKIQIFVFFLILTLLGLWPFFESAGLKRERERMERRKLAKLSALSFDQRSFALFDRFARDNFGFRLYFVRLHSWLSYYLFNTPPNERYFQGQEDLFFRGQRDLTDIFGDTQLSKGSLQEISKGLEANNRFVQSLGAKYLFFVAPRKSTVYKSYLPKQILAVHGITKLQQLDELFAGSDFYLPLSKALIEISGTKDNPLLYYKTDAHWNHLGAYYGYQTIINKSLIEQAMPLSSFKIVQKKDWYHPGFLAETGLKINEDYTILLPQSSSAYSAVKAIESRRGFVREGEMLPEDGGTETLDRIGIGVADMPFVALTVGSKKRKARCRRLVNTTKELSNVIILVGDSFLEKAAPYFSANAHLTYFCRQTSKNRFKMKIPDFDKNLNLPLKPQLVVHEVAESYL
jgi:hypothetical protein